LRAVGFQNHPVFRDVRRQPKDELAGLSGDARIQFLRRAFVEYPLQIDAHARNAATFFGEHAATDEDNGTFIDSQIQTIAQGPRFSCLDRDIVDRADTQTRLAKLDAVSAGMDARDYKVAALARG